MVFNEYTLMMLILDIPIIMLIVYHSFEIKIKETDSKAGLIVAVSGANLFYWITATIILNVVILLIPNEILNFFLIFHIGYTILFVILIFASIFVIILALCYPLFRDKLRFIINSESITVKDISIISKIKWKAKQLIINPSDPISFQADGRKLYLNFNRKLKHFYSRFPNYHGELNKLVRILNVISINFGFTPSEPVNIQEYINIRQEKSEFLIEEQVINKYDEEGILWKGMPSKNYINKSCIIDLLVIIPLLVIFFLLLLYLGPIYTYLKILDDDFVIVIGIFIILYLFMAPVVMIGVISDIIPKLMNKNSKYLITNSKIVFLKRNHALELLFKSINQIEITKGPFEARFGKESIATICCSEKPNLKMKNQTKLIGISDYLFLRNLLYEKMALSIKEEEV
ncbi:MAG: hypothetical protein EAX96_17090 [Candidatus Lokiarchaeota archaeon]|nr:hypothetical protein [Candidatus Lokiarchaeota archaeon]